jgi:hypothetical protein
MSPPAADSACVRATNPLREFRHHRTVAPTFGLCMAAIVWCNQWVEAAKALDPYVAVREVPTR